LNGFCIETSILIARSVGFLNDFRTRSIEWFLYRNVDFDRPIRQCLHWTDVSSIWVWYDTSMYALQAFVPNGINPGEIALEIGERVSTIDGVQMKYGAHDVSQFDKPEGL
jgi:hypothetical protein